jgi:hypothetical protein
LVILAAFAVFAAFAGLAAGRAAGFAAAAFFVFAFAIILVPPRERAETAISSHGCNVALFQLGDTAAAC